MPSENHARAVHQRRSLEHQTLSTVVRNRGEWFGRHQVGAGYRGQVRRRWRRTDLVDQLHRCRVEGAGAEADGVLEGGVGDDDAIELGCPRNQVVGLDDPAALEQPAHDHRATFEQAGSVVGRPGREASGRLAGQDDCPVDR